ncbi:MAG TPA: SIS domain-containing protein [Gaiellaceae bacterium]|nr:SIS domain-containing protein [Gaiellaceae bacterium]
MSAQPHGTAAPGTLFLAEIHEQPAALARLLEHEDAFEAAGRLIAGRRPGVIRLVGHGSSDAAASYGVYAFGLLASRTALRDSISLSVYYDAHLDLADSVVIALSQSGMTPDVVEYARRARADGALTLAVTNAPASDLAAAAEVVLPLSAGVERAVAASKTYLNQVAALALLAACTDGRGSELADGLRQLVPLLDGAIGTLEHQTGRLATAFAHVGRMFVIGRGVEFATAREIALKLTETCRVAAEPLTATDLVHGPIAAVDPLFPVWTIATHDECLPAVQEASARATNAGAVLVASGSAADEIAGAEYRLPVPLAPQPLLSPLLSVVTGQLFAAALARAKGLDADRPEQLSKVTLAR